MTTYFVTRHAGAREWADQEGLAVDDVTTHLEVSLLRQGDVVLGTLPVHLVADVCDRGARYFHLTLDVPPEMRGRELSAEVMRELGAYLEEYHVVKVPGERCSSPGT